MITRPTVLVLGAGASRPFRFPTGRELVLKVCADLGSTSDLRQNLLALGHSEGDLNEFRRALDFSMQPSVDVFLERRPEFMPMGKAAIAAALIPYENEANLSRSESVSWYEYLWQRLTTPSAEEFQQNRLTVITFNYDRSLEYFLYRSLRHSYNLQGAAAAELLRRVPVIHVYGQLGNLPPLGENGRTYSPEVRQESLERWANSIRIFTERVPEGDPNFQGAWHALSEAEVVCFLGFGYHDVNLERLRVGHFVKGGGKAVFGSAYGIGRGERPAVERVFDRRIQLGDDNEHVLDVLRRWAILK